MAKKKSPSKAATRKAAKVLSSPKSTKSAKSSAGKTLAKASTSKRSVKSAPKAGKFSRAATRRAVLRVASSRARKK